ncbi:MAG: nitroreductase family protein [Firmicutes bacterium]|nr:nitroreductase family protein [Bacillota bacterium]
MTKSVIDAIWHRRSIREFTEEPVSDSVLTRLIEAACHAPSAGNRQPWFFYVVKDGKTRRELARAAFGQSFLEKAPVNIVVCAEPERSATRYGKRGAELYCLQDTAAAVQNILLCATGQGLGTCWVGAFDEEAVSEVLDIPLGRRPVAVIPVGYSESIGRSEPPTRRTLDEVIRIVD